jgi:hypothetical protein
LQAKVIYIIIIFVNLLLYIYSTANIKAVKNKNIFPNDFFEVYSQQNSQKDHPKLLNPRNTVRIIPSNINEIKAIIEETEEENVEHTQQKKIMINALYQKILMMNLRQVDQKYLNILHLILL